MRILAIDLAKQSFHAHGISAEGKIISRRVCRQGLLSLIAKLAPAVIAIGRARPPTNGGACSWLPDTRCG